MARAMVDPPPESPRVLNRGGVLEALGYKSDKTAWTPFKLPPDKDVCHKCGKKVYPVEKITVGVLYHRGCFKCHVCSAQLSLKNFQQQVDQHTGRKEVYCNTHVPRHNIGLTDKDALGIKSALEAQRAQNARRGVGYPEEGWEYDHQALEFQHLRRDPAERATTGKKVKRTSTLRSFQDFERYGIFDAQSALERVQKEEETQLYLQMAEDRQVHIQSLQDLVLAERDKTVRELAAWFEQKSAGQQERKESMDKVEQYFSRILEERVKLLERRLAAEEQAAVARMTEKHAQEMIALIAEKENQAEEDMKRLREKFERDHQVEEAKKEQKVREVAKQKEIQARIEEREKEKKEHPEGYYNQVEFIGHMGSKSSKFSTTSNQGSSENVVITANKQDRSKGQAVVTAGKQGRSKGQHKTDQSKEEMEESDPLTIKLTQMGTSANPTPRQIAAGFVPITPVRTEAREAPGSVDWSSGSESPDPVDELGSKFSAVKVDLSDDSTQFDENDEEEQFSDEELGEEEQGEDDDYSDSDTGSEESGHTKSTGDTLNSTGSGSTCAAKYDQKGKPFVSLETPADIVKKNARKATHPDRTRRRRRQRGVDDSAQMEGSYNIEEAEYRDNKINEQIHRSMMAEVSQPKVVPPRDTKSKLYTSPQVFAEFDNNAIEEAKKDHKTYTDLVRQLSVRCTNELQKVRAIFRWLTVKDLNKISFDEAVDPDSPMAILRQIKQGAETYHNLFKRLCSYAGLHCEIIDGYSKGAGYKPGTNIQTEMFRNQWTAVWVEGSWRFINTNWGARHVKRPGEEVMTYKCDEFYFLTDPHEHIFQHYPDAPKWQLLKQPISIDRFMRMPVVKSPFFNLNLAFGKEYQSILQTETGLMEIRLLCPKWYNFAAKLKSRDHNIPSEALLERLLIRTNGQDVVLLINLPAPGKYYLDMFVAPDPRSDSMDHACGFMIHCPNVLKEHQLIYPQVGMFGRTPYFDRFKFEEETHVDPYIISRDDIVLALTMRTSVRMSHTFRLFNTKDRSLHDCDQYVFLKHKGDSIASYIVRCPRKGLYIFSIMAESYSEESQSTGNTHTVFRYLIDCKAPSQHGTQSFPKTSKRWQHCKLLSPTSGDLPANTNIRFKLESSVAKEMVVVIGEKWNYLENSGNNWQGVVNTGTGSGKLFVYGRIDTNRKKYIPCLEYFIVNQV